MDKIEEVKKLKSLLDDGVITEEDFSKQKKKLLEIDNIEVEQKDTANHLPETKISSLDEYEKKLTQEVDENKIVEENVKKENEAIRENFEESPNKDEENSDYYEKEKLKERAKLDAKEELKKQKASERNATIKDVTNTGVSKILTILKWIITIFMIFCGIVSIGTSSESGGMYIIYGILMILIGLMACPYVTKFTTKFETYTKYKKIIVICLVILLLILMAV